MKTINIIGSLLAMSIVITFILSCNGSNESQTQGNKYSTNPYPMILPKEVKLPGLTDMLRVVEIDSCQYVIVNNGGYSVAITHHENCKNPKH